MIVNSTNKNISMSDKIIGLLIYCIPVVKMDLTCYFFSAPAPKREGGGWGVGKGRTNKKKCFFLE